MYYIMLQCFNYVKVKQMSSALLKLVIPIDISKRTHYYMHYFLTFYRQALRLFLEI